MRQHGALGRAGGATGVLQYRERLGRIQGRSVVAAIIVQQRHKRQNARAQIGNGARGRWREFASSH